MGDYGRLWAQNGSVHRGLSAAPVSQLHCLLATDVPRGDGFERIRPLPQDAPTVVDAGKFAECKTGPLSLGKIKIFIYIIFFIFIIFLFR